MVPHGARALVAIIVATTVCGSAARARAENDSGYFHVADVPANVVLEDQAGQVSVPLYALRRIEHLADGRVKLYFKWSDRRGDKEGLDRDLDAYALRGVRIGVARSNGDLHVLGVLSSSTTIEQIVAKVPARYARAPKLYKWIASVASWHQVDTTKTSQSRSVPLDAKVARRHGEMVAALRRLGLGDAHHESLRSQLEVMKIYAGIAGAKGSASSKHKHTLAVRYGDKRYRLRVDGDKKVAKLSYSTAIIKGSVEARSLGDGISIVVNTGHVAPIGKHTFEPRISRELTFAYGKHAYTVPVDSAPSAKQLRALRVALSSRHGIFNAGRVLARSGIRLAGKVHMRRR